MARARRSAGRRTDYAWNGLSVLLNNVSATPIIAGMVTVNQSSTLMRTRGEILLVLDGPGDGDTMSVGCGLIIGTDDNVAAGATAFPSPVTDLDAQWLWHGFILLRAQSASQSEAGGGQTGRLTIDSKAMRKVRQNDQVVLAVQGVVLAGSPTADGAAAVRGLFGS